MKSFLILLFVIICPIVFSQELKLKTINFDDDGAPKTIRCRIVLEDDKVNNLAVALITNDRIEYHVLEKRFLSREANKILLEVDVDFGEHGIIDTHKHLKNGNWKLSELAGDKMIVENHFFGLLHVSDNIYIGLALGRIDEDKNVKEFLRKIDRHLDR